MLLEHGVETLPVAIGMQAFCSEVINEIEGNEVSLDLPNLEGGLAQGTLLADHRPVLNADVAEGVAG